MYECNVFIIKTFYGEIAYFCANKTQFEHVQITSLKFYNFYTIEKIHIFLCTYQPHLRLSFYPPPDEVGAGGIGVTSDVCPSRVRISFPEQNSLTCAWISLIFDTHIP